MAMKLRAFVLDDDKTVRSLTASILEDRGYEVLTYSEPLSCPIYLDRECPCPQEHACADIIITDINMPNVTGVEFIESQTRNGCKAIVQNKAVMSGTWTNAQLEWAKRIGCRVFDKLDVIDQIGQWLDECEKRINPNRKLVDLTEGLSTGQGIGQ